MTRVIVGFAICLLLGAGVALSGLGRMLPLDDVVPPPVPERWAALPGQGRVELFLVGSEGLVSGLAAGLSRAEVARHKRGALALVDGRVLASSAASARSVLRALAWDALPIEARQLDVTLTRFAPPQPASLAWRAQRDAYLGLRATRDTLAAHPSFGVVSVGAGGLLLLHMLLTWRPRRTWRAQDLPASPWRRRRAERPVRVVLVPDAQTLAQLRLAIGEEHVVAATEHAFAFADGWILAARKGSVFELVSELGWRMRPIEMATRTELAGEGHALSPLPGDDGDDTLGLVEALHVCGPVAHGTVPRIASRSLSHA
jgi:hypothetical protein